MLTTIEQLEKDIEEFQKFISSRNQLSISLQNIVSQFQVLTTLFEEHNHELDSKISYAKTELANSNNLLITQLRNETIRLLESLSLSEMNFSEEVKKLQEKLVVFPEEYERLNNQTLDRAIKEIDSRTTQRIHELYSVLRSTSDEVGNNRKEVHALQFKLENTHAEIIRNHKDFLEQLSKSDLKTLQMKYDSLIEGLGQLNDSIIREQAKKFISFGQELDQMKGVFEEYHLTQMDSMKAIRNRLYMQTILVLVMISLFIANFFIK